MAIFTIDVLTGAGNTAGIEYDGDYSASFSNRSLIDKGYADTKLSMSAILVDGIYTKYN